MKKKTIFVGILVLTLMASGIIYVMMPGEVRLSVSNSSTVFYVFIDGKWNVSGTEYNMMYNGSKRISMNSMDGSVSASVSGDIIKIVRKERYGSAWIIDTYTFNGSTTSKENFPVDHEIEIINGSGLIYQYEARGLDYRGPAMVLTGINMEFGKSMKVTWDEGFYSAKVSAKGQLDVRYRVASNHVKYHIKMFDALGLYLNGNTADAYYELGTTAEMIANGSTSTLLTCINISNMEGFTVINCSVGGSVRYNWTAFSREWRFNDTSLRKNLTVNGSVYVSLFRNMDLTSAKINLTGFYNATQVISTCLQETANVSTSCGGLSTGTYGVTGLWDATHKASLAYDGVWSTYGAAIESESGIMYINYTKPVGAAFGTKWVTISDGPAINNYTVPTACWSQSPLQFMVNSTYADHNEETMWYCWNGTSWGNGTTTTPFLDNKGSTAFYDEAILWNMSVSQPTPEDVEVWINGTMVKKLYGRINGTKAFPQHLSNENLTYAVPGSSTTYLNVPPGVTITGAFLTLTGVDTVLTSTQDYYGSTQPNITWTTAGNQTLYFGIPRYSYVSGATLNISGFAPSYFNSTIISNQGYESAGTWGSSGYEGCNAGGPGTSCEISTNCVCTPFRTTGWAHEGTYSFLFHSGESFSGVCYLPGDYGYVSQDNIDLTNVGAIRVFYTTQDWTDNFNVSIRIDNNPVWYGFVAGTSGSILIDTNAYTGSHNISFRVTAPAYFCDSYSQPHRYLWIDDWEETTYYYPKNVAIYVGDDTTAELNLAGWLNDTTSPQNVTLNVTEIQHIIDSSCSTSTCIIPLLIGSTERMSRATIWPISLVYGNVPQNVKIDTGADGDIDWTYTDILNTSTLADINTTALQNYVDRCSGATCSIPLVVTNERGGSITIVPYNINYTYNPIDLGVVAAKGFLRNMTSTYANVSLDIKSQSWGTAQFDGVNFTYNGPQRYNVSVYTNASPQNVDYSLLDVVWSNFSTSLPYTYTPYIIFAPKTNSSLNVTPWYQTSSTPLINFTSYGRGDYQGNAMNMSVAIKINGTISCINETVSNRSEKGFGFNTTTSYQKIYNTIKLGDYFGMWFWRDYFNCSTSGSIATIKSYSVQTCCSSCKACW